MKLHSLRLFHTVGAVLAVPGVAAAANVTVAGNQSHQTMEGFGATTMSMVYNTKDNIRADLRPRALEAAYKEVGLNTGSVQAEPFESPSTDVYAPANDDNDPNTFNQSGFNWVQSDNIVQKLINPAKQYGFTDYYLGPVISTGYALKFVNDLRGSDYQRFLDEIAEHVLAISIHWRDAYGITPRYLQLWNEPLSGNREFQNASPQELVDVVKRTGDRMKAAGFTPRFIVPSEETTDVSHSHASMILADAAARQYVGAISYHPYPYGSEYAAVPKILSASGAGTPHAGSVEQRRKLKELGAQYGVPVFMVEVSHSELGFDDFDNVRGRAIHIHDELEYADAAAFFGMNALWDTTSHAEHFAGRDPGFYTETDTIVLIDNTAGTVRISPMGHAIGHFARWIRRGAVRVSASSDDPLVLVTAFRDGARGRAVLVAINNAAAERPLSVTFTGMAPSGTVTGERSTAGNIWAKLSDANVAPGSPFTATLPARSITTFALPTGPVTGGDGGAPGGAGGASAGGQGGSASGSGGAASGGTGSGGRNPSTAGSGNRGPAGTDGGDDDGGTLSAMRVNDSGGCGTCATQAMDGSSSLGRLAALLALTASVLRRRSARSTGRKDV